jgi:predicted metal-dependent hydrolase
MQQIILDGQTVNYAVKRSQRARHVRLEIHLESGLTVVVPYRYNTEGITRFLYQKRLWILRKLEDCRKFQSNNIATVSDSISYLGQKLKIIEQRDHNQLADVSLDQNTITVNLGADDNLVRVLETWFRSQAEELITRKVDMFSQQIGVRFSRLTIRNARTRWGSCSRLGNLNFNWKLIKAPEPVIDYVIIHELCHLKEMNHSPSFWNLVERHCTNCYEQRSWLKQHEAELV